MFCHLNLSIIDQVRRIGISSLDNYDLGAVMAQQVRH